MKQRRLLVIFFALPFEIPGGSATPSVHELFTLPLSQKSEMRSGFLRATREFHTWLQAPKEYFHSSKRLKYKTRIIILLLGGVMKEKRNYLTTLLDGGSSRRIKKSFGPRGKKLSINCLWRRNHAINHFDLPPLLLFLPVQTKLYAELIRLRTFKLWEQEMLLSRTVKLPPV